MTFLNPAVLFGLIAASVPILLHFLNLRKLKKIEFSTLSFLKELQKTKIRRIKLKQWLLLLLRVLIIIFLVLAFARPTVKSFLPGSSAKTTAVFLIDNTFSMSVVDQNGSYFNQSKQSAKNLLSNFQNGDEIAVLPFYISDNYDLSPKTDFSFVKKEIDGINISHAGKTLNEALIKAGKIIYESKNYNKEIYILTDLQKNGFYNLQNELSDLSSLFAENVRIYLLNIPGKETVNLGVDDIKTENQIFEKNKTIGFTSKITNYSQTSINNSVASLFINGKRSSQQSINLAPNESKEFSFETTLADTGIISAHVELEDDDVLQDNKRYTAFYVPESLSILIVTEDSGESKFIKLALGFGTSQRFKITEINRSRLTSQNLNNFDVVCLIASGVSSYDEKLSAFVESGKSLILFPGSKSTLQNFQNTCRSLNLPMPQSAIGKINSTDSPAQFDKIDLEHPLFKDLFEDKSKNKIESPDIFYYYRLFPAKNGRSIISLFDGSSFLSEYKSGIGKILLFGSAPDLGWNTFPLKASFAPLIYKSFMYASSVSKDQNNFLAGNEITANITGGGNQIKVLLPDNGTEFINTDSLTNKNFLTYGRTDNAGVYKFYSGSRLRDFISVNHDQRESDLQKASDDDFKSYLEQIDFKGSLVSISIDDDIQKTIYQSRFGTELWKYFLLLALITALLEMFVAKSSKKDLNE